MREVVCLQVGSYANFVGAHFWNFQDELLGLDPNSPDGAFATEVDSDVLYKVGETRQGTATYTPRLLAVDIKGSLGALPAVGFPYETPTAANVTSIATWKGPRALYQAPEIQKNAFQRSLDEEELQTERSNSSIGSRSDHLEGGREVKSGSSSLSNFSAPSQLETFKEKVRYWTDYLKAPLHPSSVLEVRAAWQGEGPLPSFRSYAEGQALVEDSQNLEEIGERLRMLAEACDHLQAFQCSIDEVGGFSPLGAETLQVLNDEYSKVPRLLFSLQPPEAAWKPTGQQSSLVHNLTSALAFATLSSQVDLYIPLGRRSIGNGTFPHLPVDDAQAFHTSSVYASAMDTLTLPYRFSASTASGGPMGAVDAASFVRLLARTPASRVACAAMSLPAPTVSEASSMGAAVTSLAPVVERYDGDKVFAEALILRGLQDHSGDLGPVSLSRAEEFLKSTLGQGMGVLSVRHMALSRQSLAIPFPFPPISRPQVSQGGRLRWKNGVSVFTRLGTGPLVVPLIELRLQDLLKNGLNRSSGRSVLAQWGFDREAVEGLGEHLQALAIGGGGKALDSFEYDSDT